MFMIIVQIQDHQNKDHHNFHHMKINKKMLEKD